MWRAKVKRHRLQKRAWSLVKASQGLLTLLEEPFGQMVNLEITPGHSFSSSALCLSVVDRGGGVNVGRLTQFSSPTSPALDPTPRCVLTRGSFTLASTQASWLLTCSACTTLSHATWHSNPWLHSENWHLVHLAVTHCHNNHNPTPTSTAAQNHHQTDPQAPKRIPKNLKTLPNPSNTPLRPP